MLLKELKPVLTSLKINLYLEYKKPIKFESYSDGVFRQLGSTDVEDVMYKKYGNFEIEQIYANDSETITIDLVNK